MLTVDRVLSVSVQVMLTVDLILCFLSSYVDCVDLVLSVSVLVMLTVLI